MEFGTAKSGTFLHPSSGAGISRVDEQDQFQHTSAEPSAPLEAAAFQASAPAFAHVAVPSAPVAAPAVAAEPEPAPVGSVDTIRDIIFGTQMRDYDTRFARLEQRLIAEATVMREETSRRFDALEAFVRQQFEALGQRLATERGSRAQAVEDLSQRIGQLVQHVEQRTAQIDEQASRNQRELQQQLHDQSRTLGDEIRGRFDALSAALDRQTGALRDEKADRASIAALLTEMARRLHAGPEQA